MISLGKNFFGRYGHSSEEQLVLLCHGELEPERASKVQSHLAQCERCRMRLNQLQRGLSTLIDARADYYRDTPARWDDSAFEIRLAQARQPERTRTLRHTFFLPRKVWQAACLASLAGALWLYLSSPRNVSANEVFERVHTSEAARLNRISDPIIYQHIRFRRINLATHKEEVGAVETWRDLRNSHVAQKGGGSLWREVSGIFPEQKPRQLAPLSGAAYRAWSHKLPHKRETVSARWAPDGSKLFAIRTTPLRSDPGDTVVSAELVVRERDWHPVEERIWLDAGGVEQYDLVELAFGIVPRASLDPGIFGPAEPAPAVVKAPVHTSSPTREPALEAPDVSGPEVAVLAFYALHSLHTCLGEQVAVVEDPAGHVIVRGLVETADRKRQIAEALENIPALEVDLQTIEDTPLTRTDAPDSPEVTLEARSQEAPLAELLRGKLTSAEFATVANQAVSLSHGWMREAWALRHLAEAFPQDRIERMPESARHLLAAMVRDHASAMSVTAAAFHTATAPYLGSSISPPPAPRTFVWPDAGHAMFADADAIRALVQALFAGEGVVNEQVDQAAQRLSISVTALANNAQDLAGDTASLFQTGGVAQAGTHR